MKSESLAAGEIVLLEHETHDTAAGACRVEDFSVRFVTLTDTDAEFDLVGLQAPMVNAFRRLLLSDVPSMAIEKVYIHNNTSVLQDEVLAHRLGLVPLRADPMMFEYRADGEPAGATDTLLFRLQARCTRAAQNDNSSVYSSSIRFLPRPEQQILYTDANVGPVHDDILLAKMRPGHELYVEMEAVKGVGRDHAKFSPVATAWYRQLPSVRLTRRVTGEQAQRLRACFSPGVIGLRTADDGQLEAHVVDTRYDNCSRNVFRQEDLRSAVVLGRVKDHVIFTVESVGVQRPEMLFIEATRILTRKCRKLITLLELVDRKAGSKKSSR